MRRFSAFTKPALGCATQFAYTWAIALSRPCTGPLASVAGGVGHVSPPCGGVGDGSGEGPSDGSSLGVGHGSTGGSSLGAGDGAEVGASVGVVDGDGVGDVQATGPSFAWP